MYMMSTQFLKLRRAAVLFGIASLFGACIPLSRGRVYANLRVSGKIPSNTLIAENSNTCTVSAETFANVRVGDNHRCVWSPPGPRRAGATGLE